MTRKSVPHIPVDKSSGLHQLAEEVYADYIEQFKVNKGSAANEASALAGLGYSDWIIGGSSYTRPETPRRRMKVLERLQDKPYFAVLTRAFNNLGFNPPERDCGKRVEPLDQYVNITKDSILEWGLRTSLGMDILLCEYDRLYLKVHDHGEVVATRVTEGLVLNNAITLEALGLTDDDYRFEVGYEGNFGWGGVLAEPGTGHPRGGRWFDWAVVEGVWKELDYQGYDWDGEYRDV